MIRSSCLILASIASLVAFNACASGGGDDDDGTKNTRGGNGGSGNGNGFGGSGQGGSGFSGSGQGGSGQGGSGQGGSGFGGSGQGGSGFGGSGQGGSGFGGSAGTGVSGFGGSAGTGVSGAAGTGPAGTGGAGATQGVADLIDDMELGTGSIPQTKGRIGAWYTYNDGTTAGMQTPTAGKAFVVDPAGFAGKCARTNGSGFTVWGAGMGVDLNNPGGTAAKGVYTGAAAYTGITFMAKSTSPFRIKVLIPATVPTAEGGTCTGAGCGNNHGFIVPASATWTSVSVPFSSLTQETWAEVNTAAFSSAAIIGIQFQVTKDTIFDVAIDNLGFY